MHKAATANPALEVFRKPLHTTRKDSLANPFSIVKLKPVIVRLRARRTVNCRPQSINYRNYTFKLVNKRLLTAGNIGLILIYRLFNYRASSPHCRFLRVFAIERAAYAPKGPGEDLVFRLSLMLRYPSKSSQSNFCRCL